MGRKKSSIGCLFWTALVLLVLVIFLFNRSTIESVLDKTGLHAEVATDLYVRLGRVCEEQLRDDARAIEAYVRAVEQAGDAPNLLEAPDRLYSRAGDAQSCDDILDGVAWWGEILPLDAELPRRGSNGKLTGRGGSLRGSGR